MAKRKAVRRVTRSKPARKTAPKRRSAKRPTAKTKPKRLASAPKKAKTRAPAPRATRAVKVVRVPRLDRVRRTLEETVPTPPSSLDMDRYGSAARSGRAGMEHRLRDHHGMSSDIAAGDVDVDVEDAYFTGEEAPGGDNSTPGQDVVDEIGTALGVHYDDNEELKGSDKVVERDKHRWEMDPASAEDYKDRK
jgi:hypothetical protein